MVVAIGLVTAMVASLLALGLFNQSASADAGNPILGTIKGTIVDTSGNSADADTRVTVYVHGQWNWLSHGSDCNTDRAGAGVGIIWNDPTEPGFAVTNGVITAGVGVASLRAGDTDNVVDEMVHPDDIGNVAEGYPGLPGQVFADPATPGVTNATAAQWKGGCGREPLSATASGAGQDPSGQTCGNGTVTCAGHPWGSWGFAKVDNTTTPTNQATGVGYQHTFASMADVSNICVNFYDVHGGGTTAPKFQRVSGASQNPNHANDEIDVNGNSDNSIKTNSFNPSQGANCVSVFVAPTTTVTGQEVQIRDFAKVQGFQSGGSGGTVTFKLYKRPDPPNTPDCSVANLVFTSAGNAVDASGNASVPAPGATLKTTPGGTLTWDWEVTYTGDAVNSPSSSVCGTEFVTLGGNTAGVDPP